MHVLYLLDIENYGNSYKTVRYCFNLHALNISIELLLAAFSFFSFIVDDLHIALFLPKNISIQFPVERFKHILSNKTYFSNFYYYMSPVYYFSSNANTVIELVTQKLPFKSISYLKSKSKNSPSATSHIISLFQEMQKIPFVAKIATVPISNPSSSAPFVVSSDADPFNNYFSIKSVIKSFRNSPNFFRFYLRQLQDTICTDDIDDNIPKNYSVKTVINQIYENDEYEDDKYNKICKVEESFFAFDPLQPYISKINESEIKKKSIFHRSKSTQPKSETLFINFLFYSSFVSNFHSKNSHGIFYDFTNAFNYEIVVIITVLLYIGLRLYLLISNCISYKESQKAWKSLILLPNASTIDLMRCQHTCIICRNKMTIKTSKRLRCHHCIHLTCLVKWTKLRNRCPLCQEEIIMSQDGNGHYSYFYNYNRNIFNHSVNKNRKNKIKTLDDFYNFIIGKNNQLPLLPLTSNDGIGKNSDEDEQEVSPYLLFYVCSLRKFRFLKRHLVILNKKCSSNVSHVIDKKKSKMNNKNKKTLSVMKLSENKENKENSPNYNNELVVKENTDLWHKMHNIHLNNKIKNDEIDNNDEIVNNDNMINYDENINNNDNEVDVIDVNEIINNRATNDNENNIINFVEVNHVNNNDVVNNRATNINIIHNNDNEEINVINLDEFDVNNINENANIQNNNNLFNNINDNNFTYNPFSFSGANFHLSSSNFLMSNLADVREEIDDVHEELAARKLVSQYKSRFEFDRALLTIVYQEMINNFPFLLKEEIYLNNQQKELLKTRGVSKDEIEENIQISQKLSLLIKKYRAAFKEIEEPKPWTIFSDPFEEFH